MGQRAAQTELLHAYSLKGFNLIWNRQVIPPEGKPMPLSNTVFMTDWFQQAIKELNHSIYYFYYFFQAVVLQPFLKENGSEEETKRGN